MITRTGKVINPYKILPSDIDMEDIAAGLSKMPRFAGQSRLFYSVAQHSCLVAAQMEPKSTIARIALLHDATEAYIGDLATAVKQRLPDYRRLERRVWNAICARFCFPSTEIPEEVVEADYRMLSTEWEQVVGFQDTYRLLISEKYPPYEGIDLSQTMTPDEAEGYFLDRACYNGF